MFASKGSSMDLGNFGQLISVGRPCLAIRNTVLVMSRLNYCNDFFMDLPLKTALKLQIVKSTAARTLVNSCLGYHVTCYYLAIAVIFPSFLGIMLNVVAGLLLHNL